MYQIFVFLIGETCQMQLAHLINLTQACSDIFLQLRSLCYIQKNKLRNERKTKKHKFMIPLTLNSIPGFVLQKYEG